MHFVPWPPPPPGDPSQTFLNTHSPCWALLWLFHGGRVSEYQPPFFFYHAQSNSGCLISFEFIKHHIYIIPYLFFSQSWQKFLCKRFASDSNRTGPRGQRFLLEEGLWNGPVNELSKDAAQPARHSKRPLFFFLFSTPILLVFFFFNLPQLRILIRMAESICQKFKTLCWYRILMRTIFKFAWGLAANKWATQSHLDAVFFMDHKYLMKA